MVNQAEIKIGSRVIGPNHPPFVIAEVGINHEGSLEKAMQCVDAAVQAQADCIKFQCHITECEMIPTDMTPGEISKEKLWDIIKRCELTEQEEIELKYYCEKKSILYLCTPFSVEAADRLEKMNVAAYKIGSGECNNYPLLKHIAKTGKPIILSTGMNDLASIKKSVALITGLGAPLALTHCTSMYPTPYEKVRLGAIAELYQNFNLPIGLSDHSNGIYTCLGAVALGACILEKHFTPDKSWPGPDIPISIDPTELAELVKGARAIHQALGGSKTILPEEKPVIDFAYASVVATRNIQRGEVFTAKNIWVKRPGTGAILATKFDLVLGKKAACNIELHHQLAPNDIDDWS